MDHARFCRCVVFGGVPGINNVIIGAVRALCPRGARAVHVLSENAPFLCKQVAYVVITQSKMTVPTPCAGTLCALAECLFVLWCAVALPPSLYSQEQRWRACVRGRKSRQRRRRWAWDAVRAQGHIATCQMRGTAATRSRDTQRPPPTTRTGSGAAAASAVDHKYMCVV